MMRKVFLPIFLAVMLLPAIVLAQSTNLPEPGEKSTYVTAPPGTRDLLFMLSS